MKYHIIYASESEKKVLEVDTDTIPPNIGDLIQLPLGENKEMCQYCAVDVYYAPKGPETTIFYIDLKPA